MIEYGNELYFSDNNEHIWEFDQFGSKFNKLKINTSSGFQIESNALIYNNGKYIFHYSLLNQETSSQNYPFLSEFTDAKINKNAAYLLKKT
ncbi:MAG: hypothetical protein HC831_25810 [Chloroflexia bacterium]|nr:hypothetical protein [Chloroflexia bacterium]